MTTGVIISLVLVATVFGCASIYQLAEQQAEAIRLREERDACERTAVSLGSEACMRARQAGHAPTIEAESWAARVPGRLP